MIEHPSPVPSEPRVSPVFNPAELAAFERDGYAIVRGLASGAVVERMIAVTEAGLRSGEGPVEYEADLRYPGAPASREQVGGQTIRRLKEAQGRDPVFTDWVRLPGVISRLQQLLGPRVVMPLALVIIATIIRAPSLLSQLIGVC